MPDTAPLQRGLIVGRPALIVIDIQQSAFVEKEVRAIPHMADYAARVARARLAIDRARETGIPIVFIQEIHRADLVDFGRELDGSEDIHCLDNNPETDLAREVIDFRDGDYLVQKRRYSAFYGTDLEILLRGLRVDTLLLTGGLTDVCVHYTFVDGHQGDYYCRVIEDCVAGSSPGAHEYALRAMEYLQTGARRSLDEVLAAMDAHATAAS